MKAYALRLMLITNNFSFITKTLQAGIKWGNAMVQNLGKCHQTMGIKAKMVVTCRLVGRNDYRKMKKD